MKGQAPVVIKLNNPQRARILEASGKDLDDFWKVDGPVGGSGTEFIN